MEYLLLILIVFIGALVSTLVGWLWYSPKMFGRIWMKESGVQMPADGNKKKMIIRGFFANLGIDFITSAVFLLLLISFGRANPFILGFFLWLGLIVPTLLSSVLHEKKSWKLFWINAGYRLVGLMPIALIFFFLSR